VSSETILLEWMEKIETIGESKNNLDKQIFYLSVIKKICSNRNGNMNLDLLSGLKTKMRIRLFSIGSNPGRKGVIQFFHQKDTSNFYVGFYKPGNCKCYNAITPSGPTGAP
jgi:hypothetical protein